MQWLGLGLELGLGLRLQLGLELVLGTVGIGSVGIGTFQNRAPVPRTQHHVNPVKLN